MPCFKITFTHSAMRPEYVGKAIKYANTPDDAVGKMQKSGTSTKSRTIIDKQRNTLTIISINEIQD